MLRGPTPVRDAHHLDSIVARAVLNQVAAADREASAARTGSVERSTDPRMARFFASRLAGPYSPPSQRERYAENAEAVHRAWMALPDDECAALGMHVFGGLTYSDVAAGLGVSETVAKSRAHQAIATITKALV